MSDSLIPSFLVKDVSESSGHSPKMSDVRHRSLSKFKALAEMIKFNFFKEMLLQSFKNYGFIGWEMWYTLVTCCLTELNFPKLSFNVKKKRLLEMFIYNTEKKELVGVCSIYHVPAEVGMTELNLCCTLLKIFT